MLTGNEVITSDFLTFHMFPGNVAQTTAGFYLEMFSFFSLLCQVKNEADSMSDGSKGW